MASSRSVVVSEVLWFVNMQFSKITKSEVSAVLNSFYTNDEVLMAKKSLFDFAATMAADYLPTYVERKGANKQRANVDDILALYALLDAHKVELPCYTVLDLSRVPSMESKSSDSSLVMALTGLVDDLRHQVATLVDKVELLMDRSVSATTVNTAAHVPAQNLANEKSTAVQPTSSWAD